MRSTDMGGGRISGMALRAALGGVLLVAVGARVTHAQSVVRLGTPTAKLAEEFTRVAGVREESNGRVVIVDSREQRIVRADLASGAITALGRSGRGPGEYTIPLRVYGWSGDTSFVPDMEGAGRAVVITAAGVSPDPLRTARVGPEQPLFEDSRIGFDGAGRLYSKRFVAYRVNGKPMSSDSNAIERLDRATGRRDTVARVHAIVKSPLFRPVAAQASPGGSTAARSARGVFPFASVDQWAVAADGRVAVVSVEPYRVRYYSGRGQPFVGPVIAHTAVRVSEEEKRAWRAEQSQPVLGLRMGADRTIAPFTSRRPVTEPDEWSDVLPPFLMDALRFAPDGNLWIERAVAAGRPPLFDVIDRAGRVTKQVELPSRTRLVGFGARSLYLVRLDEDDLETLERYALP